MKKKYLNGYEHDAMWMSYRYAIGRYTAAATMHAGHMVQNVYGKIPEEQIDFDVFDMRREINRVLEFDFNFGLDIYTPQCYYDPIKALIQLSEKVKKDSGISLLDYLKNNRVTAKITETHDYEFINGMPIYPGQEKYEMRLHELLAWANVANALDSKKHHKVTTKFSGEEKTYEAFEYVTYDQVNGFHVHYTSIDNYLENPFKFTYISKEFITKIDDKEYEFGKEN